MQQMARKMQSLWQGTAVVFLAALCTSNVALAAVSEVGMKGAGQQGIWRSGEDPGKVLAGEMAPIPTQMTTSDVVSSKENVTGTQMSAEELAKYAWRPYHVYRTADGRLVEEEEKDQEIPTKTKPAAPPKAAEANTMGLSELDGDYAGWEVVEETEGEQGGVEKRGGDKEEEAEKLAVLSVTGGWRLKKSAEEPAANVEPVAESEEDEELELAKILENAVEPTVFAFGDWKLIRNAKQATVAEVAAQDEEVFGDWKLIRGATTREAASSAGNEETFGDWTLRRAQPAAASATADVEAAAADDDEMPIAEEDEGWGEDEIEVEDSDDDSEVRVWEVGDGDYTLEAYLDKLYGEQGAPVKSQGHRETSELHVRDEHVQNAEEASPVAVTLDELYEQEMAPIRSRLQRSSLGVETSEDAEEGEEEATSVAAYLDEIYEMEVAPIRSRLQRASVEVDAQEGTKEGEEETSLDAEDLDEIYEQEMAPIRSRGHRSAGEFVDETLDIHVESTFLPEVGVERSIEESSEEWESEDAFPVAAYLDELYEMEMAPVKSRKFRPHTEETPGSSETQEDVEVGGETEEDLGEVTEGWLESELEVWEEDEKSLTPAAFLDEIFEEETAPIRSRGHRPISEELSNNVADSWLSESEGEGAMWEEDEGAFSADIFDELFEGERAPIRSSGHRRMRVGGAGTNKVPTEGENWDASGSDNGEWFHHYGEDFPLYEHEVDWADHEAEHMTMGDDDVEVVYEEDEVEQGLH